MLVGDYLLGNSNANIIQGGNDKINGDAGDDVIFGDFINGNGGIDQLTGGDDVLRWKWS